MVNTTTNQNALIEEQVQQFITNPLQAASVVLNSGPRIIDSAAPVRVPRLISSTEIGFVGEGEQIPDDYTVANQELRLMPEERKSLKVISRVTNELVRSAAVGVSSLLQQRIVDDMRQRLDEALLNGDGTNNTITGILNQAGTQAGALDLTEPDSLLDGIALATAAEVTPNRWFINGGDFIALRKIKDADGRYIIQPDITAGATYVLHGIPVTVSNRVPAGKIGLVDMNEVVVVRDTEPTVKILDQTYADTDEIGIRVTARFDLGLVRPEGVVILEAAA